MIKVMTSNFRIDHELTRTQSYLSAQITLYISLGLLKLDWILLLRKIFLTGHDTRPLLVCITTGVIILSTSFSVLSFFIGCLLKDLSPEKPSEKCSGMPTHYMVSFILDMTTDVFLALLPSYLIMPVQTDLKRKLKFSGVFAVRLTLVALATISFVFWQDTLHSRNPEAARAIALAIQAAQLWCSIILCMAIRLIKLIRCFNTNNGMGLGFIKPIVQGGRELDTNTSTRNGSPGTERGAKTSATTWDGGAGYCASQKSTEVLLVPERCVPK